MSARSKTAVSTLLILSGIHAFSTAPALAALPAGTWTNFTNKNIVTCLQVSGDRLWAGTTGGAVLWNLDDMSAVAVFSSRDGLADTEVLDMAIDRRGFALFATPNGISRFDGQQWETSSPLFRGGGYTQIVLVDSRVRYWTNVGSSIRDLMPGIDFFTPSLLKYHMYGTRIAWTAGADFPNSSYQFIEGFSGNAVDAVEDRTGNLWFATDAGVLRLGKELSSQLYVKLNSGLIDDRVYAVAVDSSNALWFGTGTGLCRLQAGEWTAFKSADGLVANFVTALAVDVHGALWCGTEAGVCSFDGARWTAYRRPAGIEEPVVLCAATHARGDVYFGTMGHGLLRFDGMNWTNHQIESPPVFGLSAVEIDKNDTKYFVARDGLLRYDNHDWKLLGRADGLKNTSINDLAVDSSGCLWLATNEGVGRLDGSSWRWFYQSSGLAANTVTGVVTDRNGDVWFSTFDGISRYDGHSWISYRRENSRMSRDETYCAAMDGRGHLWFGSTALAIEYDGNEFRNYVDTRWMEKRASGDTVFYLVRDVIPDPRDAVWFNAGDDHVARFDYHTNFWTFDPDLPVPIMNHHLQAMTVDRSNNIWLATSRGLGYYDGTGWELLSSRDGPAYNMVKDIGVEEDGTVWLVHHWGVSRFEPAGATGIQSGETGDGLPERFVLQQNFPNPFNAETAIRFNLPREGRVELTVFNGLGQVVRSLRRETIPPGEHVVTWDGRDDSGRESPSGIYYLRMKMGDWQRTIRMVLLK